MRKQYYLQPSDRGLLAWDVDRLVALTAGMPVRDVPLADLSELDETHWFHGEDSRPTCRVLAEHFRLVQAADLSYPIILSSNGRVMDGMHRVVKAYLQRDHTVRAVQLLHDVEPDFVGVEEDQLAYERNADAQDP